MWYIKICFSILKEKLRGIGKNTHEKQLEKHNFQQSVGIGQRANVLPLVIIEIEYCNLQSVTSSPKSYMLPNVRKCIIKLWTISLRVANSIWVELLVSIHKTHSFYRYF